MHDTGHWLSPSVFPALPSREVHVWKVSLRPPHDIEPLRDLLDEDELARADRFIFDRDRIAHTISHAALRQILGAVADRDPASLRYETGPFGKPALIDSDGIAFNMSHSGELALIAVGRYRRIGIDVECTTRNFDDQSIEQFFSPAEVARLRALPINQRRSAFFACWTRKEAYIKAIGKGLSCPLDSFDVSLAANEPPALLAIRSPHDDPANWRMLSLCPADDYAAAIVAERPNDDIWSLRLFSWPATAASFRRSAAPMLK